MDNDQITVTKKDTRIGLAIFGICTVATAGITYALTRNYYLGAIKQMNQVAHDAGVLETILEFQKTH